MENQNTPEVVHNRKADNIENKKLKKQAQDEKSRENKILVELNKSLNSLPTVDAKYSVLFNKFVEISKENARYEILNKQNDKKFDACLKEKEVLLLELNKSMVARTKLESLCRELQKYIKDIKDESFTKLKEEEEKRIQTKDKFQKSLNEITTLMNENNEKNKKLRDDNIELSQKFKQILEQYDVREKQVEKANKQLDLANQLNDAKMAKLQMEKSVEKEIMLREKAELLTELERNKKQIVDLSTKERLLKEQLNMYTEKYEDFQNSIKKSSTIFTGYKSEIDKMSKNMKKLEKETYSWRTKFEKSNSALLDLMSEKQVRDEHITKTARQLFQLQKLCRTLQTERAAVLKTLKDNNVECPPMPDISNEPEPDFMKTPKIPVFDNKADKMEVMARNCSELKENLLQLQGQLNEMTNKSNAAPENLQPIAAVSSNKNKNKNKKNKNDKKTNKNNNTDKFENSKVEDPIPESGENASNDKVVIESSDERGTKGLEDNQVHINDDFEIIDIANNLSNVNITPTDIVITGEFCQESSSNVEEVYKITDHVIEQI